MVSNPAYSKVPYHTSNASEWELLQVGDTPLISFNNITGFKEFFVVGNIY